MTNPTSFENNGYLEGQMLVATPNITGSSFKQSVILICAHGPEGAMGIIINHPLPNVEYADLFQQFNLPAIAEREDDLVLYGGPVEANRGFVIYKHEERFKENAMLVIDDLAISGSIDLLTAISKQEGPKQYLLTLGYSGWSAGQLEKEMEDNSWISVPISSDLILSDDHRQKWQHAAASDGIDLRKLSPVVGHA